MGVVTSLQGYLAKFVFEGRREPFANLKDFQNVIRDKWHDVDDKTVRKAILQWQSRTEDPFSVFSADQLTDTNYCDVLV